MNRNIDCLFIGHNEMLFTDYEKLVRSMGVEAETYRDLNLSFIQLNNKPYTALDTFNLLYPESNPGEPFEPLKLGSLFSATISYLGTYLQRRGLSFDFVSSFQTEKEALVKKLQEDKILTIAITTTLYISMFPIIEIVSFIRKYNTTAKIIVGGPFIATNVRTQDEITLEYLFDSMNADFYVNSSQGEATLVKLIEAIKKNTPLQDVHNIHYRLDDEYIATPVEIENNQLGENMVDWSLFQGRLGKFVSVRTAISCPFSCAFCGFPKHAGKYQTANVDVIEAELNKLEKTGGVKSVYIIDDTFNIPKERFKEILRMMIKNKYSFKWHSYFRCQFADPEMIEMMEESGCEGVFLGIESGNQQILDNMNKSVSVEKYAEGMSLLKKSNIVTLASFIIGFPGETAATVQDTIDFIENNRPDFYRAQLWYCEQITPIWEQREKYKIKGSQFNWSHQTMNSKAGCDLVDKLLLTVKNSIWVSQFAFDFDNVFQMLHRGMSLAQVKNFIASFNSGMQHKMLNPKQPDVTPAIVGRIKESLKNTAQ